MIREHLFHKRAAADPLFRWRGGEVSRLEAFSDAVFALTLTLLVVSVSAPTSFYELYVTVRDLPIFLVSFAMLMMAWFYHYQFFRRYGLEDAMTTTLNAAFMFLVVFFAYPLKFLATFLWGLVRGDREGVDQLFQDPRIQELGFSEFDERVWMMHIYAIGIIGVFGVLALMVGVALKKRKELELDELELFLTKRALLHHCMTVSVALLSVVVLMTTKQPGLAGITYFIMGPLHGVVGWRGGVRAEQIHQALIRKAQQA